MRELFPQLRPATVNSRAHGTDFNAQDVGDLVVTETFDVAQDDSDPELLRQRGQRRLDIGVESRVVDGILGHRLGADDAELRAFGEPVHPDAGGAPSSVQEQIRRDAVQPAGKVARLETVEGTEHPDEDVLGQILGVVPVAGEAIRQAVNLRRVFGHDGAPIVCLLHLLHLGISRQLSDNCPYERMMRARCSVIHPCTGNSSVAFVTAMLNARRRRQEPAITSAASLEYAEAYVPEDSLLQQARRKGVEVGAIPIGAASGAVLQFLASVVAAKSVAEIGTGAGVSGLWLLRGLAADGVLTSVDREAENQRLAKEAFTAADIAPQRYRLITGSALDVMPRLNSGGYDLVFIDGDKTEYGEYLTEAKRLVRPGGLIAFDNTLWHDRVADPAHRDPDTTAIRSLLEDVANDDDLLPVLLPTGDGLLIAQLRQ